MKIRMILGEYDQPEPLGLDVFLAPVELPMEVERLDDDGIPDGGETPLLTLHTEAELGQWAGMRFAAFEIFDMIVEESAIKER